jgi:hypothetical protein
MKMAWTASYSSRAAMSSAWRSMIFREFSLLLVPWPAMKRVVSDGFGVRVCRAGHDDVGHAVVGADRAAVVERLPAADLLSWKVSVAIFAETHFAGDHLLGEIALADEIGHDEHPGSGGPAQRAVDVGLLLPEALDDLGKYVSLTQFVGMLMGWRRGVGVQRGAVSDQDQRGVFVIVMRHGFMVSAEAVSPQDVGRVFWIFVIQYEALRSCRRDSRSSTDAAVTCRRLFSRERARLACPHRRLADESWREAAWISRSPIAGTGEYGGGAKFDTRGRVCSPENAWPLRNCGLCRQV